VNVAVVCGNRVHTSSDFLGGVVLVFVL